MPVALGIANSPVFLNLIVGGSVTPPDAPTNLTAVVNGSDIDLTWIDNSTDEDGFKIYRSSDNIIFVEIDDIAAGNTNYTDLNPGAGVWYYYVAAYNAGGESDSNVASVFIGALDSVPNMVHIYDIARRWVSSYNGDLVRLRRNSDSAELDFSYVANGDLDVAAITTWLGGASGFIVRIYDQISGDNVTQATAGNQPLFVASGQNGRAVSRRTDLATAEDRLRVTFASAVTQPYTIYAVGKVATPALGSSVNRFLVDGVGLSNRAGLFQRAVGDFAINAGTGLFDGAENDNWNIWSVLFSGVSSELWLNGSSAVSGNAGEHSMTGIVIGTSVNNSSPWTGDVATIAIADPSHDIADRETVQNALGDYYGITIT